MSSGTPALILLDTHYWIWLQDDSGVEIPARIRSDIDRAATAGRLLVSVISIWELGVLESKRRIELASPIEEWIAAAIATPGLQVAPLTPEIATESSRLPGLFHPDPADRIIVATARKMGARLLTRDERILEYGRQRHVPIW